MLGDFLSEFWAIIQASSPYLLLGLAIAGFLHLWLSESYLQKHLGQNQKWAVLKAALLGIPLPLCSCSVIPMAVGLRRKGASAGATSSFLISTPETGVDSIALTYALMDLPMAIFRPFAAFVSALSAGLIQNIFNSKAPTFAPVNTTSQKATCCQKTQTAPPAHEERGMSFSNVKKALRFGYFDLLQDFSLWMLGGFVATALISQFIPINFFTDLGSWNSKLLILGISIPLYVCASASTPIAASLMLKGLSPGSALLFLLLGPATNLANIMTLNKYLGIRGTVINLIMITLCALVFSETVDFYYTQFPNFSGWKFQSHLHHSSPYAHLTNLCSLILLSLMARGIWVENLKKYFTSKEKSHKHTHTHS